MSAPLQFWGTAHPPPRKDGSRDGIADLSSAEIASTDMGKNSTSVLVEHDKSARVGTVSASWEAMDGSLHVAGTIHDPKAAQDVRSGKMRGLSLGTSVIHDGKGNALCRSQEEISICEVPRRSNCWISRIDGVPVLQTVNCSQKHSLDADGMASSAESGSVTSAPAHLPSSDAGVSNETHNMVKDENAKLREQLANLKAKHQVYEERQREAITGMKGEVGDFCNMMAKENPQHAELGVMCRWAADIDKGDSLETNLSIGRLISCASGTLKRHREDSQALSAKSTELAAACKKIEELEGDVASKSSRIDELKGLLDERTDACTKLQNALAQQGAIVDKFDFSKPSAREAGGSSGAGSSTDPIAPSPAASSSAPAPNFDDALFAFVSKSGRGSLRIGQSGTNHHLLGSTGADGGLAAALRF